MRPLDFKREGISFFKKFLPRHLSTLCLIGFLFFSASCSQAGGNAPAKVEPPPDIPTVPRDLSSGTHALKEGMAENPDTIVLLDKKNISIELHVSSPALKRALTMAMERGVVSTELSMDVTKLEDPITRGEFALWLAGFRRLEPKDSAFASFQDVPKEHPFYSAVETVASAQLMKGEMTQGSSLFRPSETMSREVFCVLYVEMLEANSQKDLSNGKLDDFDQMKPSTAKGVKQNFERFVDYATITQTYRNHVALAYQDKVLGEAFGLTPTTLTEGDGFHPHQSMTRKEALLFLSKRFNQ